MSMSRTCVKDKSVPCSHFLAGRCTWGERCRFSHSFGPAQQNAEEQVQRELLSICTQVCYYAFINVACPVPHCPLQHKFDRERLVQAATRHEREGVCHYLLSGENCAFGPNCRFSHAKLCTIPQLEVLSPTNRCSSIAQECCANALNLRLQALRLALDSQFSIVSHQGLSRVAFMSSVDEEFADLCSNFVTLSGNEISSLLNTVHAERPLLWLVGEAAVFWPMMAMFRQRHYCGSLTHDLQIARAASGEIDCLFGSHCFLPHCPCYHPAATDSDASQQTTNTSG